jgi:hypothetical protein
MEITAGTEMSNLAGIGTEISVQVKISAGTEPVFGRSLLERDEKRFF